MTLSSLQAPLEVLPSLLLWAPEFESTEKAGKVTYVDTLRLCDCDGEPSGYYVEHYQVPKGCGEAFGPFALDLILIFCRRLRLRLVRHTCADHGSLCLTTGVNQQEDHTNALVLLGAYLILVQGWTANRITETLGSTEANRKFPCAWVKSQASTVCLMTVRFCWEGLELATKQGWIDTTCLSDDQLTESFCEKYRDIVCVYDAAWIVPGKILVSSDPVTTMYDPNPETFTELWPSEDDTTRLNNGSTHEIDETSTASTDHGQHPTPGPTPESCGSVETVCKQYTSNHSIDSGGSKMAYASFLQDCGVSLVIRANFEKEPGMPRRSYDAWMWGKHNIGHRDIQIVDKLGGLPQKSSVDSLLAAYAEMATECPGAVNIHCKGGFGRSVVLCCCLAIHDYNVPGSALLGWVRIARPGAITNPLQEEFLISSKGRADILKLAGRDRSNSCIRDKNNGANIGCGMRCSLQ